MIGLFPPNSSVTRFRFVLAAPDRISCPTYTIKTNFTQKTVEGIVTRREMRIRLNQFKMKRKLNTHRAEIVLTVTLSLNTLHVITIKAAH